MQLLSIFISALIAANLVMAAKMKKIHAEELV